jgi:hypothetical protein
LFLVERKDPHAPIPVAFLPRRSFRHIAPVPSGRGVVSCEWWEEHAVAVISVGQDLAVVRETAVSPAIREPQLHQGRVLARQGKSWREIVGVDIPETQAIDERRLLVTEAEARLSRGQAALVPVDDAPLPMLRMHNGRRVLASCRARGAEVVILDGVDRNTLEVLPDDGPPRAIEIEPRRFPSTLQASPDGRRVLVAGRNFLHAELFVEEAELRPVGDPMTRRPPNRGIDVACYIAEDRILFPLSGELLVRDTHGGVHARVKTSLHEWPNLAVASSKGEVLFRTSAGEAVLVRTRDGEIALHEQVGTQVAHIFAHGERLFAMCKGVACEVRG